MFHSISIWVKCQNFVYLDPFQKSRSLKTKFSHSYRVTIYKTEVFPMFHRLLTKNSLKYYKNKQVNYLSNIILFLCFCPRYAKVFLKLLDNLLKIYAIYT